MTAAVRRRGRSAITNDNSFRTKRLALPY